MSESSIKTAPSSLRSRFLAALAHLIISAVIAGVLAAIVFTLWYPMPQRDLVGGGELFWLVVIVDVIMGPLLTAVVFNTAKGKAHLARDLAVIAALQLSALAYGAHTVWVARPAILAFEIDRLRVVTAAEIDQKALAEEAIPKLRELPWGAPRLISSVKPTDSNEFLRSLDMSAAGIDLGMQPGTWQEFDELQAKAMWDVARPVDELSARFNGKPGASQLSAAIQEAGDKGFAGTKVRYLPIVSKKMFWTALINESGQLVSYASIDPF